MFGLVVKKKFGAGHFGVTGIGKRTVMKNPFVIHTSVLKPV